MKSEDPSYMNIMRIGGIIKWIKIGALFIIIILWMNAASNANVSTWEVDRDSTARYHVYSNGTIPEENDIWINRNGDVRLQVVYLEPISNLTLWWLNAVQFHQTEKIQYEMDDYENNWKLVSYF